MATVPKACVNIICNNPVGFLYEFLQNKKMGVAILWMWVCVTLQLIYFIVFVLA